mgnify:CR=1 FL=1
MSNIQAARTVSGGLFFLVFLLAAGCATLQTDRVRATADAFPQPVELTTVPFFPQEEYQCGPAALATVLNGTGVSITPEQLVQQVYLPERRGSLQLELIGAARRHGRIPYVLRPELESLLAEVASGNPVLILQNLSFWWYPKWHYAVVVGFDLPHDRIVLRSGKEQRHDIPIEIFERTWRRSHYWAMVVLSPDRLPFTAEEIPYLQAVAPLERLARWPEATTAYNTALKRWPKSLVAQVGLGNSRYALGDVSGAEEAFRQATQDHPERRGGVQQSRGFSGGSEEIPGGAYRRAARRGTGRSADRNLPRNPEADRGATRKRKIIKEV